MSKQKSGPRPKEAIKEEKSRVMNFDLTDESMTDSGLICGGKLEIFVEPVLPVPTVVIFGAGHISTQLSKIATVAGFKSWIVDDRPIYANDARFPEAENIFSESFEEAFAQIKPDQNTYLVIVTRGHQEDENVLRWAIQTEARYIGMIGSKRKIRTIARKLESEGATEQELERVHMPDRPRYRSGRSRRNRRCHRCRNDSLPPSERGTLAEQEGIQGKSFLTAFQPISITLRQRDCCLSDNCRSR